MSNNEKNYIIGCPDPYSVAETVAGKNINWTEQNDVFDTMAECYGITKEGYLSADSPLQAPYDSVDEKGNARRLSNKEAEERLNAFLEKYARPEKRKKRNTQFSEKAISPMLKKMMVRILPTECNGVIKAISSMRSLCGAMFARTISATVISLQRSAL